MDTNDKVINPPHYCEHPSGVECITIAEHFDFCIGNVIKYVWRAGLKGHSLDDYKKAMWYLQRKIDSLESVRAKITPQDYVSLYKRLDQENATY